MPESQSRPASAMPGDHAPRRVRAARTARRLAVLGGGLQRLPREIGLKRATGMLLTGRRVTAQKGMDLGFVNKVAGGDVMEAARSWASQICACSPMSIRATRQAAMRGLSDPLQRGIAEVWTYPEIVAMLASADALEGPAAFAAKRAPQWQGR